MKMKLLRYQKGSSEILGHNKLLE